MGAAYCIADGAVWEFVENNGAPQFRLCESDFSGPVTRALAGFSFRDSFYSLALTATGQLLTNFSKDEDLALAGASVSGVWTGLGLDVVRAGDALLFRGACDEAYCPMDVAAGDGYINFTSIESFVPDFTPMLTPFDPESVADVLIGQGGTVFLLKNGSVFALGDNARRRFCVDDPQLLVPTHILDGVSRLALGNGFLSFVPHDFPTDVFVCGEFPDYSGTREMRRIRGPIFPSPVAQLQAAGQALFARTTTGDVFWAGEEDDDGRVGRNEAPEWDEIYFEGLHVERIAAGVGGTFIYGWRDSPSANPEPVEIPKIEEDWDEEDYRRWESETLN